ncbi:MAG: hypothetical protein IJT97_04755 [Bacteroidaceae bacterium]|nr:hypothetical protein [Bacteroidaceae bacterium]
MKLKSILIAAVTLTGFASNAKADTTKLLEADGWTKITALPTASDIANNYYVFVDNSNDLMLTISKGDHNNGKWYSLSLWYQTSVSPNTSAILSKLWILQKGSYADGSYALQNVEYPARLLQTESSGAWMMETNDVSSPNDWSELAFAYNNSYWTIENKKYNGSFLGPWEETEAITNLPNNRELAGNKSGNFIGRFQIYSISRNRFKENYMAAATSDNPVDVSFIYVSNPTLDLNIDGWTRSATSLGGSAAANYCTETWHSSTDFKFYQTVSSLPEGAYQVSLQARSQTNSGAVYVTVGENSFSTPVNTTTSSTSMQTEATTMLDRTTGKITTPTISLDEGQTLTMGFMDNAANHWDVFDNFKLYYIGNDLTVYKDARDAVITTASDATSSNFVTAACEAAIQEAIDANNGDYTTKAEYVAAQNAIQLALDTYFTTELQDAYANFYAFKAKIVGLTTGQESNSALTTFNTAVNTATANVEAATTAATITAQIPNLRSAGLTYISSVEGQFDITFLASQVYSDWKKTDGSAAGIVQDQFLANRPSTIPSFAENFEWTAATTGNVLYQTVSDLPAGYYQVGMYTMALSTSGRDNIATEATEGDADRSFAFAGDLDDASSIQRTGMPVKFATAVDFDDLTILDVNVHLSDGSNALTFGVQKDRNGSNWHFAQIASIIYSNAPDLTNLRATRDALVAEATGLKNGADADYLTSAQKEALQSAITAGNNASTFDDLNTVTLITLPNAINTAKQQIAQAKAAVPAMLAALERFESDYNLVDGTDYRRVTMSAEAWTDLLAKVNAVTTALDDISQASTYVTKAQELVSQMDATDASLRLFKSYKAMVDGTTALDIVGTYDAASNMDTDATEQTAITALNTAFGTYANARLQFDVSAFLGDNLDFSAAAGSVINSDNSNTIKNVTGWEVAYADADTWAVLQTDQSQNVDKLYIRKNWGERATVLKVFKQRMLPVGKYKLSLSWNSDMKNMTNLSQFVVGETVTPIGEDTDENLTYTFEVTNAATPFDLTIGFQKRNTGDAAAQIIVDDISLVCYQESSVNVAFAPEGFATYYNGQFDFTLPEGMKARIVTENNNGMLTYETIANGDDETKTVPAGTAVMLQVAAGTENGTLALSETGIDSRTFSANLLHGSDTETTTTGGSIFYKLTYGDDGTEYADVFGWYWGANEGAAFTSPAHRAWLALPSQSTAKARFFGLPDDSAMGIESIAASSAEGEGAWYTLSGLKLSGQPSVKGLYIHNGRKVLAR